MPKLPQYSTFISVDPSKSYDFNFEVLDSYKIENINIIPNQDIVDGLENDNIISKDQNFYKIGHRQT